MDKKIILKKEEAERFMDLECSGAGECHPEMVDGEDLEVTPTLSDHKLAKAKEDKANKKPEVCRIRKK